MFSRRYVTNTLCSPNKIPLVFNCVRGAFRSLALSPICFLPFHCGSPPILSQVPRCSLPQHPLYHSTVAPFTPSACQNPQYPRCPQRPPSVPPALCSLKPLDVTNISPCLGPPWHYPMDLQLSYVCITTCRLAHRRRCLACRRSLQVSPQHGAKLST